MACRAPRRAPRCTALSRGMERTRSAVGGRPRGRRAWRVVRRCPGRRSPSAETARVAVRRRSTWWVVGRWAGPGGEHPDRARARSARRSRPGGPSTAPGSQRAPRALATGSVRRRSAAVAARRAGRRSPPLRRRGWRCGVGRPRGRRVVRRGRQASPSVREARLPARSLPGRPEHGARGGPERRRRRGVPSAAPKPEEHAEAAPGVGAASADAGSLDRRAGARRCSSGRSLTSRTVSRIHTAAVTRKRIRPPMTRTAPR